MGWRRTASEDAERGLAADEAAEGGEGADAGAPVCVACAEHAQIVEVGFIDRPAANALFAGQRKQYVNLMRTEILQADTELVSDHQLGRTPPIYIRVSPAQATPLRVKLTRTMEQCDFPAGSANRSTRERGQAHLQFPRHEHHYTTDDHGELVIDPGLPISAIGGGEYRVQAAPRRGAFTASANTVRVKRRLYIQPLVRHAAARARGLEAINALVAPMERLDIEVKVLPAVDGAELGVQMVEELPQTLEVMGGAALDDTADHHHELRPYSLAVMLGQFCDEREWLPNRVFAIDLIPDPTTGRFDLQATINLVDEVGTEFFLVPLATRATHFSFSLIRGEDLEDIPIHKVNGADRFTSVLDVDIEDALAAFPGAAALRLEVNVIAISQWGVGWAYNEHPVIWLNMHSPELDTLITAAEAQALIVHELGHKLHLTGRSQAGQPDRQRHHYGTFNSHGVHHVGDHCATGVPAGTALWRPQARAAATCTMWGALKGITTFCDECRQTLRKIDLGGGF